MAIASINVANDQQFAKGGVKSITLALVGAGSQAPVVSTEGVASGSIGTSTTINFEKESAKMTVSMSKGDGLSLYNVSIEGYIPKVSGSLMEILHSYAKSDGLIGKVSNYDGADYLVGWDNVLATSTTSTDFPLILESMEADTGAALQDQNGVTVKFSCVMATPPAQY